MMATLPPARVVRAGRERDPVGGDVPKHLLRLGPRKVPARLVWRLLFGSPLAMFGWFFAAFGMGFVLGFAPQAQLTTPDYDHQATATITLVEPTTMSENEDRIYRVHYTFVDDSGTQVKGASYTKDPTIKGAHRVEYRRSNPSQSRLDGLRTKPFRWWVSFVFLFPIIGLSLALPELRRGLLSRRLLRTGIETRGKLVDKVDTDMSVNDIPIKAMTFEYEIEPGGAKHRATVKTLDTSVLEDDALEPMLYDPHVPTRATTLDHLPGSPRITADGELQSKPGVAVYVLICPIAFVVELGIALVMVIR